MRAIVVGAGIAGLVTAHRLREAARREGRPLGVTVLEAEERPGGHARSTHADGFLVEAGPNAFLHRPREPHALELARELGLEPRLVEARALARRRFILIGGRLHRAPDSPLSLLASGALTPAGKLRLLLEPWARPAPRGAEESVYAFARRRIGSEAAERLVDAAVAGISAGDSRKLSVEAAFPLMVEMEREHGSLIRAMAARRREGRPRLLSFDGGMEVLVEALRARLGPAVRTGCRARAAVCERGRWRLRCHDGTAVEGDHLILAVPAGRAAEIVALADPELAGALEGFASAGLAVVALAYRESDLGRPLDGYGYLVAASEGLDTLGVTWESSLFDGRAPRRRVLLRVMMGGSRRPGVAALEAAELVERARRELAGPLGIEAEPLRVWVRRWPQAITQYEIGHGARVEAVRRLAARHPGLVLCGTSYDGASFGSAIASGAGAAERVLAAAAASGPREAVRAAPEGVGA